MSGKITRTTKPTKIAKEKLRAEIAALERAVNRLSIREQQQSPLVAELAGKLGALHGHGKIFRNRYTSDRINREDATLRSSWIQDPFGANALVYSDCSDEEPTPALWGVRMEDFSHGAKVGFITGTSERPGPRFHTPRWVKIRVCLGSLAAH